MNAYSLLYLIMNIFNYIYLLPQCFSIYEYTVFHVLFVWMMEIFDFLLYDLFIHNGFCWHLCWFNHEISNNSEKLLINIITCDPHIVMLLGDFNAKSKSWLVNYTTAGKGTLLKNLTSLYGMKQLTSAPTHILQPFLKLHWPYFCQPGKLS